MNRHEVLGQLFEIAPNLKPEYLHKLVGSAMAYDDCQQQIDALKMYVDRIASERQDSKQDDL